MTEPIEKEKKTWLKWMDDNKTATAFFVMTIFSIVVTIFAFCYSNSNFKESQGKIVVNQTAQIESIKSVLTSIQNNAVNAFVINGDKVQELISDSVLARIPDLNNAQQAVLNKYIKAVVIASSTETAYRDWVKEINVTLTQKQISQIQQESKSLLELEFNKIQNEYQGLILWAGILTIVFLIFSFYSLFRADDLVKQGREGLDKLNDQRDAAVKLNKESRNEYEDLKEKILKFEKSIENLTAQKVKQDFEIKRIGSDISKEKLELLRNLSLRKDLEFLVADITEAKQKILILQSEIKDPESRLTESSDSDTLTSPVEEKLDEETVGEKVDDIEPKDSEF